MITGFNTDIERDGVVYHVQTEDKGLDSPLILSLVYSGGEILAAKRTPYQDLIAAGFDEEALSERLKRQHRLICAAINAGRVDELKRMSARPEGAALETGVLEGDEQQTHEPQPGSPLQETLDEFIIEMDGEVPYIPIPVQDDFIIETAAERPPVADWPPKVEETVIETAAEAPPGADQTVDEGMSPSSYPAPKESVYTVYDSRRPTRRGRSRKAEAELLLTILNEEEFRAGETVNVRVLLQYCQGETEKPLGGISLSVKILGTTFRPRIYSVKTQRDGIGDVAVEIPRFTSGRAAVLIRAEAHDQSTELRRVILAAE